MTLPIMIEKVSRFRFALIVLVCGTTSAMAQNTYDIDVIAPMSGGAAFLGQTQLQTLDLATKVINQQGGIDGRPVRFVMHDDQTNPQVAVQLTGELIAKHPPIILGSGVTAMCGAMMPLMHDGPVMYCFSPGIQPEPGSYVFSATIPTYGLVEALIRYFKQRGWTRFGLIVSTDATGQDGERSVDRALALPDLKDMKMVERVHFVPTDISVGAQIELLRAAHPDAVIYWTTGAAIGTVFKGFIQSGYDVPFAAGSGNLLYTFMRQYKAVLPKELYFPADVGLAQGDGLKLDPAVAAAKKRYTELFQSIGALPDMGSEITWDATMIAVDALRHAGPNPTAEKVRDYIAHLKNYAGVSGMYDFEKFPQRGLGEDSAVVVRWNPKLAEFEAMSQPGGNTIIKREPVH